MEEVNVIYDLIEREVLPLIHVVDPPSMGLHSELSADGGECQRPWKTLRI